MPNWLEDMSQRFEFYIVDRETWGDSELLRHVISASLTRDSDSETLGSATFEVESAPDGECYIRTYLVTTQGGAEERTCLGTYMMQTPSRAFDGKSSSVSLDAYTPLLELRDTMVPIGYYVEKGENVLERVYRICRNAGLQAVRGSDTATLAENEVADTSDNWLSFSKKLLEKVGYEFDIDEYGRILFVPVRDASAMAPVWQFDDGNSSILMPDITDETDMFGIHNVVEVVYSGSDATAYGIAVNDYPTSPVSTVSRGRRVERRETSPQLEENTDACAQIYAERLLREESTMVHTVTFSHGYCPVRRGDAVRLDYERAGVHATAKVGSQTIECVHGCTVSATAKYTESLWR